MAVTPGSAATSSSPHNPLRNSVLLLSPCHTEHRGRDSQRAHSESLTEPGSDACKGKRKRVSKGDARPPPDSSCTDRTA